MAMFWRGHRVEHKEEAEKITNEENNTETRRRRIHQRDWKLPESDCTRQEE